MGNINPAYFDRVRYILSNKNQGSVIIDEPIGWKSDEKELSRHEQYHGIVSRFSNSSKYIGKGKDFIQLVYDIEGINAEIKLKREEKHPLTDVWTLTYSGYLDLSTWETEDNQVSIKFNSGGIEQLLKSRESEQVEIDRINTMDGKSIPELQPITIPLDGRRIFLKSKWEKEKTTNLITLDVRSDGGNTRRQTAGFPLNIVNKSHEAAQSVLNGSFGNESVGGTGMMFFANSDRDRNLKLKFEGIKFKPTVTDYDVDWAIISFCLSTYKDGTNYNLKNREYLFSSQNFPNEIGDINGQLREFNFERTNFELFTGESLALEFFIEADLESGDGQHFRVDFTEMDGNVYVDEDSFFEKSATKALLYHEFIDRLVTIDTNKENAFYSDFLGRTDLGYSVDGPASLTAAYHGFWARQFDKLPIPSENPKVENLFKPLTTSFKEAVSSLDAIYPVGVSIETIGNKERVRIEELSFFYNNNVTIRLPFQAKKVKRYVATEYYYSGLEFGNEQGGVYEEACGLDEPNTRSTYTTIINRITQKYSKIAKYRTDTYGPEFARRKPKSLNDTEDTPYDNDIFLTDLKRGINDVYEQRKWQDDLEKEPTGIFSPETATNLRYSPLNCLIRHSWWFGGGFKKYITDYVRYGSSIANSQLKTKLIGNPEYAENGNIINSELMKPRFFPEWIEFEHGVNFDIMQMVEGSTVILGKEVKNFYGLVEFINEKNEKEKGFLFNLKPNGKGVWKILKSNR